MSSAARSPVTERAPPRPLAWAEVAPDPLVAIDAEGVVLWGNPAAELLFGYRLSDAVGVNVMALVHPDDLWEATDSLRTTLERPDIAGALITVRLRRHDGEWVACEVRGLNLLADATVRAIVLGVRDVSDRIGMSDALAESERRLNAVARHAQELLLLVDEQRRIRYVSPALPPSTGWQRAEMLGTDLFDHFHEADLAACADDLAGVLSAPGRSARHELRFRERSGAWRHCQVELVNLCADPDVGRIAVYLRDIRERKREEARRAASDERFRSAFENAPIGMAVQALDGKFQQVNEGLCRLLGYPRKDLLGSSSIDLIHPEDREAALARVERARGAGLDSYQFELRLVRSDGRVVWGKVSVSVVRDQTDEAGYFISQIEDVTGRRRDEERLAHQALHDALTGLPNRALLIDRLGRELERAKNGGPPAAVLFCDLDRFKVVNDSLGHQTGDRLLVACARRLREIVRSTETVARFGGDEFVVLCTDVTARSEVIEVAQRLSEVLRAPFSIDGTELHVTTSIGIAFSDDEASDTHELLRDADAAMYRAKESGRDCHVVFEPEMRAVAIERLETEAALRQAIVGGGLTFDVQPLVELKSHAIVGGEALVRWRRGDVLVPPVEFVALAEETGLIRPLGAWMVRAVCEHLATWQRSSRLLEGFQVMINVSSRQLDTQDFVADVESVLAETGIDPASLCFEITESVLPEDGGPALRVLKRLRELGCGLAIDDFGTGYSALAHLKRFPFDTLKIDRSFVSGLGQDPEDEAIVEAVVGIARALDLRVVGEGIETDTQLAALLELGVEVGQGFVLGRPVSAEQFHRLISTARPPRH